MKKIHYILIAVAAVLVVGIVIAAVLLLSTGNIKTNDPNALYDYTVKKNPKGITVTVKGSFPDGSLFHAYGNTGAISVTEKKSTASKAVFEIKPTKEGADTVSLYLEKTGDFTERSYVTSLYLIVDDKMKIDVTGSKSTQLGGTVSDTDGDGIGYVINTVGEGICEINLIKDKPEDYFALSSDNPDVFRLLSQQSDKSKHTFRLSASKVGKSELTFVCDNRKAAVSMSLVVDDEMQITVSDIHHTTFD